MRNLIELAGCTIDGISKTDKHLTISAHKRTKTACCPDCGTRSGSVHSRYIRSPTDLPISEWSVRVCLQVRRFRCRSLGCSRRTFAELFPNLLTRYAQRTERLKQAQRNVAVKLGGEAGSALLSPLRMVSSPATLLRGIRLMQLPEHVTPRVLGVDDWSFRKQKTYGTVLVDLERHCVVDLLADRSAETLADWLRQHPDVEIISRDRSTEYARGAREGAPQATQVADRWHLLLNIRQMLERYLPRVRGRLEQLPSVSTTEESLTSKREHAFRRTKGEQLASQESRTRRLARYEQVKRLSRDGKSFSVISRELAMDIKTVRKYASADAFPERVRQPGSSILDPYLRYLNIRHQEGCENASQLWREIRQQGFVGSKRQVLKWMRDKRPTPAPTTPGRYLEDIHKEKTAPTQGVETRAKLPSTKQLAWLFIREPSNLQAEDALTLSQILQDSEVARVHELVRRFVDMVQQKKPAELLPWLETCTASGIKDVCTFATGIQQDYEAVFSAVGLPWSNGQTEGQVTRLKLLKRQMYGRANFDLLRRRVLLA